MKTRNTLWLAGMLALLVVALSPGESAAQAPCCVITAIDSRTGVVTAAETKANRKFDFKVTDANLLRTLKPGQSVYANFQARQVSLDGRTGCCAIVNAAAPEPAGATPPAATRPLAASSASVGQIRSDVPVSLPPKTAFDAKKHGFEFDNYFTGQMLVDIPGIGTVNLGDTTYGLCGGMVFAAYDTFNLGAIAPDDPSAPPPSGTPMRSYIYGRQVESLRDDNWFLVRKLIEWMRKPLHDQTVHNPVTGGNNVLERGLITLSAREFNDRIRPELDAGRPVTIVLVEASGEDMITNPQAAFSKNHQVLAIGYSRHGNEWDIDIYDPNFHNTVQTLHVDGRYQTEKGGTAHTGGFRGFFRAPYKLARPPWVPDNAAVASRVRSFRAVSLGRPDAD